MCDGHCVVTILSDAYLKSDHCMFELVSIAKKPEFWERIFPVILPDAAFHKPVRRAEYQRHWQQQKEDVSASVDGIDPANTVELVQDIARYSEIAREVGKVLNTLSKMNTLSPEELAQDDFLRIAELVAKRLKDLYRPMVGV